MNTGDRVERRLAAILAADVVGYSRLMSSDEEGTLRRLQEHRRALIDPKMSEHRGRIVKTTGDGMLVEFPSVVDAIRCAVEVQRGMAQRNADTDDDHRITFRVGVNLGDVIVENDDIFGDGVNVAARLEALAEPGGICVSRTVRNQVRDKLPYDFEDMGEQSVKNIARPVRADALSAAAVAATPLVEVKPLLPSQALPTRHGMTHGRMVILSGCIAVLGIGVTAWWVWPHAGQAPPTRQNPPAIGGQAKVAPRLSIVVLPLANLSNDPDQEYFADNITDDLTTDLSRIDGSFVIARTTAFAYKGKAIDVKQIGNELGVRYVLEGSVRRLGEQVQVNVQLIDAETGAHVWADRFDTDRANLAKTQEEITGRLARTLQVELVSAAGRQIAQEKSSNPDARDLAMRGWTAFYLPVTEASTNDARQFFEKALEIDPSSADAKVGVAEILIQNTIKGWSKSPKPDQERAEKLLNEALEYNNNDPKAHFAMGELRGPLQRRFPEAQIEFEKVLSLDRNFSPAWLQLGYTLSALGEPELALPYFEKAFQLSPRHQNIVYQYSGLGLCHLYLGHTDQAIDFLRKARATNPRIWYIHLWLAAAFGLKGDIDEAKASLAEFYKLKPDIHSLSQLRALVGAGVNPKIVALREKTIAAGQRQAGMQDE